MSVLITRDHCPQGLGRTWGFGRERRRTQKLFPVTLWDLQNTAGKSLCKITACSLLLLSKVPGAQQVHGREGSKANSQATIRGTKWRQEALMPLLVESLPRQHLWMLKKAGPPSIASSCPPTFLKR
jgi:hypothetical protein